MDPEVRAYLDETSRHFDIVAEQMRAQVQLVAEGVSSSKISATRFFERRES